MIRVYASVCESGVGGSESGLFLSDSAVSETSVGSPRTGECCGSVWGQFEGDE